MPHLENFKSFFEDEDVLFCMYIGVKYKGRSIFWFVMMVRVFANGPGNLGSIPGRVIPKTQKILLDASFTENYKVGIKEKIEQSRERSSVLSYTLV